MEVKETWKEIPDCGGRYLASNIGRIKSTDWMVNRSFGKPYFKKGRILKTRVGKSNGYEYVTLRLNEGGSLETSLVHRLIASAFIVNTENKPTINHKNGIKTDNRVENLEWVTYTENHKHAFATGLRLASKGEGSPNHKLCNKDVIKIRKSKESASVIANKFNVQIDLIYKIKRGAAWGHL